MLKMVLGILMIATMVFACNAVNVNLTWDEIDNDPNATAQYWQIQMSHGIFYDVRGLCVDGDNIRPFNPYYEVCAKYGDEDNNEPFCLEYKTVYLSAPMTYQKTVCIEWGGSENDICVAEETKTFTHKLTRNVDVVKIGNHYDELLFTKSFTIPNCE